MAQGKGVGGHWPAGCGGSGVVHEFGWGPGFGQDSVIAIAHRWCSRRHHRASVRHEQSRAKEACDVRGGLGKEKGLVVVKHRWGALVKFGEFGDFGRV